MIDTLPTDAARWTATGRGWAIEWSPDAPHLTGTAAVIAEISAVLARDETIRLTPTSAAVPANLTEPAAVLAALHRLGRPFTASASAPSFESIEGRVY